jgi:pimeloyl-ACP methyl ester carboxylesterase
MRHPGRGPLRSEIVTTWLNASFEMRFRLIGGLTVRFAVSGEHADQALLLSPWPESLLAFEPVWSRLAEHTHLVAVDLPGFGHSQRSDALLSPRAMGEFIIAVADAFGLRHPHVVAPGTGTPAALFAAAGHPGRLRTLVAGSSAAAVPLQVGGMVKDIIEAPGLDEFRRADPQQQVNAALSGISRHILPEAVRDDYLACYQGDRFAQSLRYLRACPAELPVLAGLLPQIDTPVQLIAGADDTATPPANARFLHERLPHSKLDVIDAGHFTWEDASAEYAALVTNWWHDAANGARE